MIDFKNIIWPTDFSDHSDEALKTALEFARHFKAELHGVHVVESLPVIATVGEHIPFNVAEYRKKLEEDAKKHLQKVLSEQVPEDMPNHQHVLYGVPADRIAEFAKTLDRSLIVISTHGMTGFRHFIHGSVAERVVRFSECPVLSIRASDNDKD